MILLRRFLFTLLILLLATHAVAKTKIILLGGGAGPDSSDLSIEKNVGWVSEILKRHGINEFDVLFASGSKGGSDVKMANPDPANLEKWLPIARVMSSKSSLMTLFRKNNVANHEMENSREHVIELLEKRLQEVKSGDDLLVIYHGHGGYVSNDTSKNYLRLWSETRLSVIDFIDILKRQPADVTIRFIFPQCYSGAFTRIIHNDPEDMTLDTINTRRCGFATAPDNRLSEGCTVEADETKYRDFSTFFFAALDGKTRLGKPLISNPDKNNDGKVDFREAYLYADVEAYARGVPRSTSEYFLELWEPWYVKLLPANFAETDNEYTEVARRIAQKLNIKIEPGQGGFIDAVDASAERAESVRKELHNRLDKLKDDEKKIRKQLKRKINLHWPELIYTYTDEYLVFVEQHLPAVNQWLLSQTTFVELVKLQDEIEALEHDYLNADRDVGMHMRLQRAIHLAMLRKAVAKYGSEKVRAQYQEILACESWNGITK